MNEKLSGSLMLENQSPPSIPRHLSRTLHSSPNAHSPPDRLPPHSPDAEQGILGCLLLDPSECMPECVQALKGDAEHFYDLRHRSIFEAMAKLATKTPVFDIVMLAEQLRAQNQLEMVGGLAFLSSLMDATPSAANLAYYMEIVRDNYLLRRVLQACGEASTWVFEPAEGAAKVLDRVEKRIMEISQNRVGVIEHRMPELIRKAQNTIQDLWEKQGQLSGIASGYPDLDKKTNGFKGGEMLVIAARPSVGKTSFAMNIAEHVAMDLKLPVGVFSLEMSAESLALRMLCSRSRVNLSLVRDGFLAENDFRQLTVHSESLAKAPLYIDDTGGLSILEIRAKARRLRQKHGIALLVIDYLQLCHAETSEVENRQQEIAQISHGIKEMAKELNVPVIVLSQMNRDYEKEPKKRKPRLSDLRESGAIEQDADFVGLLYKPNEEDDDKHNSPDAIQVNLLIAKHRNGPTGEVRLTFLKGYTRFESAPKIDPSDLPKTKK